MTEGTTRITEVRTVGVPTEDQERALAFYTAKLGFETRVDTAFGEGQRWIEVGPVGGGTSVSLLPTPPGVAVGIDTNIRLTTRDAEADHAALVAQGVDADPEVQRWGGGVPPMFSFRDSEGNTLYVVERMDGAA